MKEIPPPCSESTERKGSGGNLGTDNINDLREDYIPPPGHTPPINARLWCARRRINASYGAQSACHAGSSR